MTTKLPRLPWRADPETPGDLLDADGFRVLRICQPIASAPADFLRAMAAELAECVNARTPAPAPRRRLPPFSTLIADAGGGP
jgi:hypothetical protein